MDATVVPAEVENSLARLGFRATTLLAPDRWLAVALDGTGHRVQLQAMDADVHDDALVARVARLRGVRHEHLTRLLDATELTPGRIGLRRGARRRALARADPRRAGAAVRR